MSGEAAENDGLCASASVTHAGDLFRVPGSWLQLGPDLVAAVSGVVTRT